MPSRRYQGPSLSSSRAPGRYQTLLGYRRNATLAFWQNLYLMVMLNEST